ncbi:sialidase family protein [Sphingobacterium siyangense]|uniref:sialidase family protein n=1 Tax=Sphingobacterium siyangense TaxID=459529 RepID=UPI003DA4F9B5
MKKIRFKKVGDSAVFLGLSTCILSAFISSHHAVQVNHNNLDKTKGKLKEGIAAYGKSQFIYRKNKKSYFKVDFGEPIVVALADRSYGWGFFQFPSLYRTDGGQIVAQWNMGADHAESYGKGGAGYDISKDNGRTWEIVERPPVGGGVAVGNGEFISIHTPVALPLKDLNLPLPVATAKEAYGRTFRFWDVKDLPNEVQGVYINRRKQGDARWALEHNALNERNLVRYSDDNLLPLVWWGDMKVLKNGIVIAGVYPGFTQIDGKVPPSDVPFYSSSDRGRSWNFIGRIPYAYDEVLDPKGGERKALGYTEPTFEVLKNGDFVAVMRTTDGLGNSPMYISRSTDNGQHWSTPVAFTKNGVLPKLRQLGNGELVLASGRPGLQLRFALDKSGNDWSDPFEMLPIDAGIHENKISCSYPEILRLDDQSFLLIYSDFLHKNDNGEVRKAIKVRKIVVKRI